MEEVWLPVVNFEGLYEISNLGNIKNSRGKLMKQFNRNGYKRVELWKNKTKYRKSVHVLVGEAFLSNYNNDPFVTHKDGDIRNNEVDNLKWTSENKRNKKLTDEEVQTIKDIYIPRDAEFGAKALAEKFRVNKGTISLIIRGKSRVSPKEVNS